MTWTLGIDTSHHVAVGLARDGEPVASDAVADTRAHGETLIPLIQRVCASVGIVMTGIEAYAVGMAGRPLHGVCSLDVIAAQWRDAPDEFVVASDARRKEFYWALYRDGIRVGEPRVSAPGVIPDLPAAGPVLDDPAGPRFLDAAVLAARWADLPVIDGEPFYLRAADAAVPRTRKSALPRLRAPR